MNDHPKLPLWTFFVGLAVIVPVGLLAYLCTPFGYYTFGIELRAPWESKARWHLTRVGWYLQDAGCEEAVRRHRKALVAMGTDAVPTLIEEAVHGSNRHYRERAVFLLKEIGPKARPLVVEALRGTSGPVDGVSAADQRGRLMYALFIAFDDWHYFDQWLSYAESYPANAFRDSFIEYHVQDFSDYGTMPNFVVKRGEIFVINPEFVKWWRTQGYKSARWNSTRL